MPSNTKTYDIRISERQRRVLHRILAEFVQNDPGFECEDPGHIPDTLDPDEDLPTVLAELFGGELSTTGINSFVL